MGFNSTFKGLIDVCVCVYSLCLESDMNCRLENESVIHVCVHKYHSKFRFFLLPFFVPNFVVFIVSSGVQISLSSREKFLFCWGKHNGVHHASGQWERICWYADYLKWKHMRSSWRCWEQATVSWQYMLTFLPFLYIFWRPRACCLHKMLFLICVSFLHFMLEDVNYKHNIFLINARVIQSNTSLYC
jgi:hypothetical protein